MLDKSQLLLSDKVRRLLNSSFSIRPLSEQDAAKVAVLMRSQPDAYLRFFYALDADASSIREILANCREDVYSGIFWHETLTAIFFLRGWDAGFEVPSFGVLVDDKYRGGAFMRLSLDAAKLICKLSGAKKLMAKIHPDNMSLKGARRLGFHPTGEEEVTGNMIYHMDI